MSKSKKGNPQGPAPLPLNSTTEIHVSLSAAQLALFSEIAKPHRVEPGQILLALACMELETSPDVSSDGYRFLETLRRISDWRELPMIEADWKECGLEVPEEAIYRWPPVAT